jgi:simple sugar transport system permease protein
MRRLRLLRRATPSSAMQFLSPLLAVALTLVCGLAILLMLGQPPLRAFHALFIEPVSTMNGVSELLLTASPLCLIALGLAIGFRANVWNIGAEGQLYLGGICATGIAIHWQNEWGMWTLPAMLAAGTAGGALWASITAFLRARLRANEILVSLMLTYVADQIVKYLVYGPWRDPAANNFPLTVEFADNALFPLLQGFGWDGFEGTRINASILITLIAIPLAWLFVKRSLPGFQLEVSGLAPAAARYAGFSEARAIWTGLLIGGAAAGLAGAAELAGPIGKLNDRWTPGYGFTAIIVAALGRLHPLGIPLAALLIAFLNIGGEAGQIALQLPKAISQVFQGLLLMFLLGSDVLVNYRVARRGDFSAAAVPA